MAKVSATRHQIQRVVYYSIFDETDVPVLVKFAVPFRLNAHGVTFPDSMRKRQRAVITTL
jgi:hypothetical protein